MKKLVLCLAAILLLWAAPSDADAQQQPADNLKTVAKIASFPVRHPIETIRGFLFAFVKSAGSAVDLVERTTAAVHAAVNKVDETVDKVEDIVKPALAPPAPAPAPTPAP